MSPIFSMKCRLLKKLGFMSTKCHIICPQNVISFVHEMWPVLSMKCLPPRNNGYSVVQVGYHWNLYRIVTIGICIGWLPSGYVQVGYHRELCIGWLPLCMTQLPLGFVQVGYHWDLYRLVTIAICIVYSPPCIGQYQDPYLPRKLPCPSKG